ncbi:3-hydroxybutyrate dehydrogenase [Amylibacter marinus]|uniref:3-hydroxybutyrate dehydrogenase n=1 Tax=Amylibacter marinus TaxID=1475483 RepID=A0ABQ5VXQ5_9RHOB|nr:3-hydroxybutyrate dehydrogenase [Amylibacter marinus]GLQ36048.1 3-hydroxybutyrate dehydrogenase [Amylibacter marinus]
MLDGKIALITGSTSGIGAGIAQHLAQQGAQVIINGFGEQSVIDTQLAELSEASGRAAQYYGADMSKPAQIRRMIADIQNDHGPIEILVNNAGIQHVAPIEDFPDEKWDAIIAINLNSAFHCTKAVIGPMKQAGWGRIVNIASAHSISASPFKSAYVAAKHAIMGLTKTVALEVAEAGVTVNAVSPGYVLTPLVAAQIPDTAAARGISEEAVKRDVLLAAQPTREFVEITDVACAVGFLCSGAGKAITGTNISMDGGWTAK